MTEQDYISMLEDTSKLVAQEKASQLSDAAIAFDQSAQLVNNVEFWKWMGANYPKDLSNAALIQKTANDKARWLTTQLQGKGYEWDYMATQRTNPAKLLSKFEAGDCPTQPGIDVTESGLIDNSVINTYQNKAYLSSNNPNLSNTPKDAIVVTNKEKVPYSQKQGYSTQKFMDADDIQTVRDARFKQAAEGNAHTTYTAKSVAVTSIKAGVISAVIGMTTETVASYSVWKRGDISDNDYLKEVLKAGGDAGITGTATSVVMIPIQAAITAAGASSLLAIPIVIVLGSAINSIVAPCFGRGKYRAILNKAKYYQTLESAYDDFLSVAEISANQYVEYIKQMQQQVEQYKQLQQLDRKMNLELKNLYESI